MGSFFTQLLDTLPLEMVMQELTQYGVRPFAQLTARTASRILRRISPTSGATKTNSSALPGFFVPSWSTEIHARPFIRRRQTE